MNWRPRSAACNPIAQHILLNRPTNMNRPRCNTGEFTENPQFRVVVIVVACLFATGARANASRSIALGEARHADRSQRNKIRAIES